jgi:glycerol-3-phosphate dehydrogenase (NAD+)
MNCGNSVRNNSSIKVAVVGSGNFGSVIARNIARNAQASNGEIDPEVKMWVYDEQVDGRSLVEIINEKHVNVKYLPDVDLTAGVVASPDLVDVARDADVLVFVVPHQFLKGTFS